MKTITKILFYTLLMCLFTTYLPANAQVPVPPASECVFAGSSASAIHYKVNNNNYPKGLLQNNMSRLTPGGTLDMYFKTYNAPGRYSLLTYIVKADGSMELFDYESMLFPIGNANVLKAKIPNCKFRVYFIKGCLEDPITAIAANTNPANPFSNGQEVMDWGENISSSLGTCEICPITVASANDPDDRVMFRLIEVFDDGSGVSNMIISVINLSSYLIGDVTINGLTTTLPTKNNIPYQFRYNYQIDNSNNGVTVRFDQRNNHNNHIYDEYQSELIILPVNTADLPLNFQICAELNGKHPEPHQTPDEQVCADFNTDCDGGGEDDCVREDANFRIQSLANEYIGSPEARYSFLIENKSSSPEIFINEVEITITSSAGSNGVNNPQDFNFIFNTATTTDNSATFGGGGQFGNTSGADLTFAFDAIQAAVEANLLDGGTITVALTDTENNVYTYTFGDEVLNQEDPLCWGGPIEPLPVELVSFKGQLLDDKSVKLQWMTASEENNDHFEIERSANGKDFVAIGMVKGNGTTNQAQEYGFADVSPMKGINYYRLRQVDTDGKFEHSKVIAISSENKGSMTINMLPNPCMDGNCVVQVSNLNDNESTVIELHDMTGRLIYSKQVASNHQNYTLSTQELNLEKGVYILSARSGQTRSVDKIVIK